MDDLKYALGFVCVFSFTCAVGFGSVIGGNVGASFTYFFALLPVSAHERFICRRSPVYIRAGSRNPCVAEAERVFVHTPPGKRPRVPPVSGTCMLCVHAPASPLSRFKTSCHLAQEPSRCREPFYCSSVTAYAKNLTRYEKIEFGAP